MRKLNKLFASAIAVAMIGGTSSAAFAANNPDLSADQQPPLSQANLVKYLQVAEGVTVPNATFTFSFEEQGMSVDIGTPQPSIDPQEITPDTPTKVTDDGSSVYGVKALSTFIDPADFDHAAVYTYYVSETGDNYTDTETQFITSETPGYLMHLYVTNNGVDEEGNPQFKIDNVTVEDVQTDDEGNPVQDEDGNYVGTGEKEKVTTEDPVVPEDPTDPDLDDDEDEDDNDIIESDKNDDGSIATEGFTFTNIYTYVNEENEDPNIDPENPEDSKLGALGFQKKVDAEKASDINNNAEFKFKLNLIAATGHEGETYTAKVYDEDGVVKDGENDKTYTFKTLNAGETDNVFYLKNGQALVFDELPAGTRWAVTENLSALATDKDLYTPAYKVTNNGTAKSGTGAAGYDLAAQAADATYLLATTADDKAIYTNTFDSELNTPTGILINNLPYIVLALVAIGGLCAYVIVRRKNEDNA